MIKERKIKERKRPYFSSSLNPNPAFKEKSCGFNLFLDMKYKMLNQLNVSQKNSNSFLQING